MPRPGQVFGIGLNCRNHDDETSLNTSPDSVVVVIGKEGHRIAAEDAWEYAAGLTVGQDLSERDTQLGPPTPPQFGLGKSFPVPEMIARLSAVVTLWPGDVIFTGTPCGRAT
ncbi:fumarylacetoacetate hydrolase family protein [Streptomyces sp. NPDC047046]|uniref:fumarylacetoacetate hydrolase family protein n=1 Tax=Streptomyces sp. NPDC047046 TaxID=3155378 RepID=UPI0033C72872